MKRGNFLRRLGLLPAAGVSMVAGRSPVSMGEDGRVEVDADGNVTLLNCVVAGGLVAKAAGSVTADQCNIRGDHDHPAIHIEASEHASITGCYIENTAWRGH